MTNADARRRELDNALKAMRAPAEPLTFARAVRRPLLCALAVTFVYCTLNLWVLADSPRSTSENAPVFIVMGIVALATHLGAIIGALIICDRPEET